MLCQISLQRPWLQISLPEKLTVLSWAINRPGFVETEKIVWRQVRNADLPPDLDVQAWLRDQLASIGYLEAVAMLTSRQIDSYVVAEAQIEDVSACCVATVGLSNGERVGHRIDRTGQSWGTINCAVIVDQPLSQAAFLEALSVATQARTAAICDADIDSPVGQITGTGTDCIAIAAKPGQLEYAGLHTPIGEAVGRAVYNAISQGVEEWVLGVRQEPTVC